MKKKTIRKLLNTVIDLEGSFDDIRQELDNIEKEHPDCFAFAVEIYYAAIDVYASYVETDREFEVRKKKKEIL